MNGIFPHVNNCNAIANLPHELHKCWQPHFTGVAYELVRPTPSCIEQQRSFIKQSDFDSLSFGAVVQAVHYVSIAEFICILAVLTNRFVCIPLPSDIIR